MTKKCHFATAPFICTMYLWITDLHVSVYPVIQQNFHEGSYFYTFLLVVLFCYAFCINFRLNFSRIAGLSFIASIRTAINTTAPVTIVSQ